MNGLIAIESRYPLTLTLSRREREQPLVIALKSARRAAEFSRSYAQALGTFLPLLGEWAGVRISRKIRALNPRIVAADVRRLHLKSGRERLSLLTSAATRLWGGRTNHHSWQNSGKIRRPA